MSDYTDTVRDILDKPLSFVPAKPPVAKLATALAAVQAEMPRVGKDATANAGTYSYKYADLADITNTILPLLGKHGLSFMCKPTELDGRMVLAYSLLHNSGEREDGIYPLRLGNNYTPQQLGSAITYGRRYCLQAMTGIAADEDDDGAAASKPQEAAPARPAAKPARRQASAQWSAYDAQKAADAVEHGAVPEGKSNAQEFADTAVKLTEISGTVDELRKNVYDVAAPSGCLQVLVDSPWQPDNKVPLSWVISEARKKIEARKD